MGSPCSIKLPILRSIGEIPISAAACCMIASIMACPFTIPGALVAVGEGVVVFTPYGVNLRLGTL